MTTTRHLQIENEFFTSFKDCKPSRINTNQRYPSFRQTHFTAGDEQQFEQYRNRYTHTCDDETNYETDWKIDIWDKYNNLCGNSVTNTFNYMFHKFKKGIFIQIRNNKVTVMLPFSKVHYINEWGNRIRYDTTKYKSMMDVFSRVYTLDGRKFHPNYINANPDQWYGNNSIFRYEYPIKENNSGIPMISDMFHELCAHYKIPDIEFFVNKRDYPLLRRDGCEPYDFVFGDNTPLLSHCYKSYAPILSMCKSDDYADICIPTWDDWARVSVCEGKFFHKSPYQKSYNFTTPWDNRIPTAIFRGGSTGHGTSLYENKRLLVSHMSLEGIVDIKDGIRLLNAGIVSWNVRPRIHKHNQYIDTFDDDIFNIPLVNYMDIEEQSTFKYIVNIDGHVSAYRLSLELGSGSVVLLVESKYKLWFSDKLIPFTHYVPIKSDLSDLYEKIRWCKCNDDVCRTIATSAKQFHDQYLQKSGILKYLRDVIISLKQCTGSYVYTFPIDIVRKEIVNLNKMDMPDLPTIANIQPILPPHYGRSFDCLRGISWYLYNANIHDTQVGLAFLRQHRINDKTCLHIYQCGHLKLMEKISTNKDELLNERIIGIHCINPILKYIPNFSYTFMTNNNTYTEYFDSITFLDYLTSPSFTIQQYTLILLQIALSLHIAQEQCWFMHHDLYPWNIMIMKYDQPQHIYYLVDSTLVKHYKLTTNIIPIIVDYGKSRGIIDGKYHGLINPYYNSTIHDILCILISSMYILIDKRSLSGKELKCIFQLSTFFSGTTYTQHRHFKNIRDLKSFLSTRKKYTQMLHTPKYELENKTPLDFVHFLTKIHTHKIQHPLHIEWTMRCGTSRHVYNYMNAKTPIDRKNAWIDSIPSIQQDCFSQKIWNRIVTSFNKMGIETGKQIDKNVYIDNTLYSFDEINYHTRSFTHETFNDPIEMELLYDFYVSCKDVPINLPQVKQFILDYLTNTDDTMIYNKYISILSIDTRQYLSYMANRNTFLYIKHKL